MTRHLRLSQINRTLSRRHPGYELVRGEGYFYVVGPGTESLYSASIYVPNLSDMSKDRWVDAAAELIASIS